MAEQSKEKLRERIDALVEDNRNLRILFVERERVILEWEAWAEQAKAVLARENRRVGELEEAMVRAIGLLRAGSGDDPPDALDVDFGDESAA